MERVINSEKAQDETTHLLIKGGVMLSAFARQFVDSAHSCLDKIGYPGSPGLSNPNIVISKETGEDSWLGLKKLGGFGGGEHLERPDGHLQAPGQVEDLS